MSPPKDGQKNSSEHFPSLRVGWEAELVDVVVPKADVNKATRVNLDGCRTVRISPSVGLTTNWPLQPT